MGHKRIYMGSRSGFFSHLLSLFTWRSKLFRAVLIVAVLFLFYYLFISDRFVITEVVLAGNKQVSAEQMQGVMDSLSNDRWLLIKKNHYLLMTQSRLNAELTARLSDVKEVSNTDRQGLHKIVIEIKERNPGFVFVVKGRKFLIDDGGSVVKEVAENPGLIEVVDQIEEDLVSGELLPNPKLVAFILSMQKSWSSKINSNITSVKVPGKGSSEVQFSTSEGWSAFFDVNRSVASQLSNLSAVLAKQIPVSDRAKLAYVDMRSEKWVYYCYKGAPCNAEAVQ